MKARDEFFIGFFPIPQGLRTFLAGIAAALILLFAAAGWFAATTQAAPEEAGFRFDFGRQEVMGVLSLHPYPLIRVTEGSERLAAGRTVMIAGGGKFAPTQAAALEGRLVKAGGVILKRGDLDMLQIGGGEANLSAAEGEPPALSPPERLGRWRLEGEICDGKCAAGAMRPGRGLAHKACATLCVTGGVPAIFVSAAPVEGAAFLLMAGPDGGPLPPEALDFMAAHVSVEGEIERVGDLLVLRIDPATLRAL